jgi:uncharacterized protein YhdP
MGRERLTQKRAWRFYGIIVAIAVTFLLLLLSMVYLLEPNRYRNFLQETLSQGLGREVTVGRASLSFWGGPGIAFEDVRVKDRTGETDLLEAKRVILRVRILPLLKKEVRWKRVVLDRPTVHLRRDKRGRLNIFEEKTTRIGIIDRHQEILQALAPLFGGSITLQGGTITFTDEGGDGEPFATEIKDLRLHLSQVSYRQHFRFWLHGRVGPPGQAGSLQVEGSVRDIPKDLDLSKGKVEAEVKLRGSDVGHFWPYLKRWFPMKTVSGVLDLEGHYEGDLTGVFKTSATLRFKEVVFDYPQVFAYVFRPRHVTIGLDAEFDQKDLRIPRISVDLPGISVAAKGRIYGVGSDEVSIDAEAQSKPFDLSEGRRFIPYGIITPDVSDPLFRTRGRGLIQILSARLSGKMSEIERWDERQNAHTLSVQLRMDGLQLVLPWKFPTFDDLRGHLVFEEGHLYLRDIEGRVFHSRFGEGQGAFYDLLHVPRLQIRCQGDIALGDLPVLSSGEGILREYGEFFSSFKELSGRAEGWFSVDGELAPPFRFRNQGAYHLSKARLVHRHLPFPILLDEGKLGISNERIQWSEAKVRFGDSSLVTTGSWRWVEKAGPFDLAAKGRMELNYLFSLLRSPLFPEGIRSQARQVEKAEGHVEGSLKWSGTSGDWLSSLRDGEIMFRRVALSHRNVSAALSDLDGSVRISGNRIHFLGLKGRLGTSTFNGSGTLSRPSAGRKRPGSKGLISFRLLFGQLNLDDLFPKRKDETPTSWESVRDVLLSWNVDARIQVAQGTFRGLLFQDLEGEMKTIDGKLVIRPFQLRAHGGDLWGEGWAMPTEKGIRFEIRPRLSNMEARAFLRALFGQGVRERTILTGRVHIYNVTLRGEGKDFQEVKESLNGGMKLEFEKGAIERGNILAKIFSILNVSQWFKGRLPDLKTEGLPYHQITATIAVQNGVASTDDFVVNSDAMRITVFGRVDLGRNVIDATVGVHPLITVDMLLSNIPVAGYILTGKNKAFLSYVYEVRGSLDDPNIEAVPIKALGEGVLGVMKRLLETPVKPFQKSP